MKHLFLRSLREVKSTLGQFISIILIIAIGSAIFSGLFSTVTLIESWLSDYYTSTNFADAWVYVKPADVDQIKIYQNEHPEITIEGRASFQLESVLKGESVTYRFYTKTEINGLMLMQGTTTVQGNEILIDASFAETNLLELNDEISIQVDDQVYTYIIKGIFHSSEFAYKSKDFSESISNKKGFGIIYAAPEVLSELNHHSDLYKDALSEAKIKFDEAQVKLDDAHQVLIDQQADLDLQKAQIIAAYSANPLMMQQILATLVPYQKLLDEAKADYEKALSDFEIEKTNALSDIENLTTDVFELLIKGKTPQTEAFVISLETQDQYVNHRLRKDHPAFTMLDNVLSPIKVMTTIFPILFFLVASIIILISMSKTIENERTQIAIFKALGFKKSTIRLSYLFYGWWAAIIGSIPFAILGNYMIPRILMAIFTTRYSMPPVPFKIYWSYNLIALGLSLFFSSVAILLALRSILKEIPAQGMRPKAPKSTQRSSLERWPWFWTKLTYTQKLITRNILMGKIKILLSSIGIVGSIALLITGLSLRNSASQMINGSINTYKFQYAIKTSENMEISDLQLPLDTEIIERTKIFAGESEDLSLIVQVIETDEQLLAIKDHSGKVIDMKDDTVIITKAMAIVFDLKVNDRVDFLIDDVPYSLIITNISNQYLNKSISISFNQAERLGLDISTDKFYVSTPSQEIKQAEVDTLLEETSILAVDTKIKYQDTANEVMKMLNSIIMVIVLSALLLSITVIYNLASINIFDRQRELATLRVLGYTVREVENLVYAENYLLTFLGAIGGLPAGIYLYQTIAQLVSSKEFIMSGEISTPIIALSLFAGFFFTFITNRILRRKIVMIKLVESLKAVE